MTIRLMFELHLLLLLLNPLMASPSTGRKVPSNKHDVCLSDYAARMPRRNDGTFLKHGGETKTWGAFSFGYFSLGKQRKVTRQEAKWVSKI